MNPLNILIHGASVLVLVCVVSAVPQGYGAGGDGGLGVDLGGAEGHGGSGAGGHGGSGVGGGSVLPFVLAGKGVLPESAIGGVGGGVSGGAAGGVIDEEYIVPAAAGGFDVDVTRGFDAGVAGGFDASVAGGFDAGFGISEEVSHVSPPVSVYDTPH